VNSGDKASPSPVRSTPQTVISSSGRVPRFSACPVNENCAVHPTSAQRITPVQRVEHKAGAAKYCPVQLEDSEDIPKVSVLDYLKGAPESEFEDSFGSTMLGDITLTDLDGTCNLQDTLPNDRSSQDMSCAPHAPHQLDECSLCEIAISDDFSSRAVPTIRQHLLPMTGLDWSADCELSSTSNRDSSSPFQASSAMQVPDSQGIYLTPVSIQMQQEQLLLPEVDLSMSSQDPATSGQCDKEWSLTTSQVVSAVRQPEPEVSGSMCEVACSENSLEAPANPESLESNHSTLPSTPGQPGRDLISSSQNFSQELPPFSFGSFAPCDALIGVCDVGSGSVCQLAISTENPESRICKDGRKCQDQTSSSTVGKSGSSQHSWLRPLRRSEKGSTEDASTVIGSIPVPIQNPNKDVPPIVHSSPQGCASKELGWLRPARKKSSKP
jgi:hypothetical protein